MRITRLVALAATTALAMTALAACGGGGSTGSASSPPGTEPAPEATTLEFWAWTDQDTAVDAWNAEHPELQVSFQKIASQQDYFAKLSAAIAGETGAPDVIQVDYTNLASSLVGGLIQDISGYTSDIEGKFSEAVWTQVVLGDGVYGVPQDTGPMVLYYRQDLFDQYGIDVPTTWAGYEEAAAALKEQLPDSYITHFPSNGAAWFGSLAWQTGGRWFAISEDAWQVSIDDAASLELAEYWQGLLDEGYVGADQNWQPTWYQGFLDDKYLTWVGPSWGVAQLKTNTPDLSGKWAVAQLPQWTEGEQVSVFWGGSTLAVTSSSTKVEAAVEFIDWMNTSVEAAELLNEAIAIYPAAEGASQIAALTEPDEFFGGQTLSDVFAEASGGTSLPWTWGPTNTETTALLNDGFTRVLNGETTIREVLSQTQEQTVSTLTQQGLEVE